MSIRLERTNLIQQVTTVLRMGIQEGLWRDRLPGERRLCADLHVGRNTLRSALRILAQEGLVRTAPGHGSHILQETLEQVDHKDSTIGILSPERLEHLLPRQILVIDELRDQLARNGFMLRVFHGSQYTNAKPETALQRLVHQEACNCWILVCSSLACQQWFANRRIPVVIAGSSHPSIRLPSLDIDYRALTRHAATTLLRMGHRRVVYLAHQSSAAGDAIGVEGFMEGCHQYPNACGIEGSVIHLPTQSWRIKNEIVRLLQRQPRPTALLVDNPYMYLTVFSIITQMGLQVPGDVSMISRQAETFLTHLQPRPACYIQNHLKFANRLARITMRSLHGEFSGDQVVRLMPQFFSGESIAPPASLSGS